METLVKIIFLVWAAILSAFTIITMQYFPTEFEETDLMPKRQEAPFLNINDTIVLSLSGSKEYNPIPSIPEGELWKEHLFEPINKLQYPF